VTGELVVFVAGRPAPQGSKRAFRAPSGAVVMTESSPRLRPWREDLRAACLDDRGRPVTYLPGAVAVRLEFVMPRPTGTPKGRTPPAIRRPDIDKLERAVLDAITSAGLWDDDSCVVDIHNTKRLAEIGETPGVHIRVSTL
jgi:crossover junction endodeoxyribonuclease RusA